MASTNAAPVYGDISPLPSGLRTFSTFPDLLMILEFVFGGLVWILVASTRILFLSILQGWVMFVSIFCFIFTTIFIVLYCIGAHGGKSTWTTIGLILCVLKSVGQMFIQKYGHSPLFSFIGRYYSLSNPRSLKAPAEILYQESFFEDDALYHFTAALFYLSASVLQAYATLYAGDYLAFKVYQENIAAVVFAYIATLLYVIHALASLFRWKRSP